MIELPERARLALKARGYAGHIRDLAAEQLQRHGLLQIEMQRLVHDAHSPFGDHAIEPIALVDHVPGRSLLAHHEHNSALQSGA